MDNTLSNKYFVKNTSNGTFSDVTTLVDGVRVLSIEGFNTLGKAVNVYKEQWVNSQTEDFMIVPNAQGQTKIVRENVDIKMTFIVAPRYATNQVTFDLQNAYDTFVNYITDTDIWVRSAYYGKEVHCVCMNDTKIQKAKLQRGEASFIIGEITLHTLEQPNNIPNS